MIVGGQSPREKELTADNLFDKLNSQVRTTSTVPFSLSHNSTSIRVCTCDNIYHKQKSYNKSLKTTRINALKQKNSFCFEDVLNWSFPFGKCSSETIL